MSSYENKIYPLLNQSVNNPYAASKVGQGTRYEGENNIALSIKWNNV